MTPKIRTRLAEGQLQTGKQKMKRANRKKRINPQNIDSAPFSTINSETLVFLLRILGENIRQLWVHGQLEELHCYDHLSWHFLVCMQNLLVKQNLWLLIFIYLRHITHLDSEPIVQEQGIRRGHLNFRSLLVSTHILSQKSSYTHNDIFKYILKGITN